MPAVKASRAELAATYPAGPSRKRKPKKPGKRVKRALVRTRCEISASGVLSVHIGHRLRNPLNDRVHWGEKRRMKEKFRSAVAVAAPLVVKNLTFTRWYPLRSKPFDEGDNLNASFKWFRDAACEWLGLPSDGPDCEVTFAYEQHVSGAYGITVRFS